MAAKENINNPGIRRLAKMAGCGTVDSDLYPIARKMIERHIKMLVDASVINMSHAKRKKLDLPDLKEALHVHNLKLYGTVDADSVKDCKSPAEVDKARKQGGAGCLFLARAGFKREVQQHSDAHKLSSDFILNLQHYIEQSTIRKIAAGCQLAKQIGKRTKVKGKDLAFVEGYKCNVDSGSHMVEIQGKKKRKAKKKTEKKS
jgi:histone H3/H4